MFTPVSASVPSPLPTISVVIITLNEAQNIVRCLSSVKGLADEVLVGDSGSTDATVALAQEAGARVISVEWQGYSATKNALNDRATGDYILSLDADEALSPELHAELLAIKPTLQGQAVSFPRLTSWCGHWVRTCGWYPDRKVRLFPKGKAHWQGAYVHETLVLAQGVAELHLEADLLHYGITSVAQHRETVEKYSGLKAQAIVAKGKKGLGWRQWLSPVWKFIELYLLKGGFRDGYAGWMIARLSATAAYLKYAKARTLRKNARS